GGRGAAGVGGALGRGGWASVAAARGGRGRVRRGARRRAAGPERESEERSESEVLGARRAVGERCALGARRGRGELRGQGASALLARGPSSSHLVPFPRGPSHHLAPESGAGSSSQSLRRPGASPARASAPAPLGP